MDTLKIQYDSIVERRKEVLREIQDLKESAIFKKYFELCSKNEDLILQEHQMYKEIKEKEFPTCNHIWVNVLHDYDCYKGNSYDYCGCIKCGLDNSVFHLVAEIARPQKLSFEQQFMYDFMLENKTYSHKGIHSDVLCDFDLAKAIYSKIKEAHPDISDELAIKYFEIALDDIRNIEVSEERKISRAKRLSLGSNFKRWTEKDIES